MLPLLMGGIQGLIDGMFGGVRISWGGEPDSGEKELVREGDLGGKVSGLGVVFPAKGGVGRVGRDFWGRPFYEAWG